MASVIIPLPSRDFDPTEAAISWKVLNSLGHRVSFATPDGKPAKCDQIMITGVGLDPWSRLPLLAGIKVIGLLLRANADARNAYLNMTADPAYLKPLTWSEIMVSEFDGILLPGGHRARGMCEYLESGVLQEVISGFFNASKPVAAICHGVLLVARSKTAERRSVLHGRKTTALTWKQEKAADGLAHFGRYWDPNYYRTYLESADQPYGFMSVQSEVTRALEKPEDFLDVPDSAPDHALKTLGLARDTMDDDRPAWVVRDGSYVSARWPGDTHTFAKTFAKVLEAST